MKIYLAVFDKFTLERYFPPALMKRLEALGEVVQAPCGHRLSSADLAEAIGDAEVVITHWGSPKVTEEVLKAAPNLRLIAHAAGSVAHIASEAVYDKGIPVISGNDVMSKYVAEGALCYMLASLRDVPHQDRLLKDGVLWQEDWHKIRSLFGNRIGLVGLGSVGRKLLNLLAPFGCAVTVYDPYIPADALSAWPFAKRAESLKEAMAQPIVSVHAAKTPETYHMIDAQELACMPDGGLLINTARGAVINEEAITKELQSGRIKAVLDVFEQEPLSLDSPLRKCDHVIIQPHLAGHGGSWEFTAGVVEDIERFAKGEALQYTISRNQYRLMTQ